MSIRRRTPLFAAIAAAALSAGGTAALSIAQDGSEKPTASAAAGAGNDGTGFPAFERAQRADDKLPTGVLSKFGPANLAGPRIDQTTARKVARIDKDDLYLAEGTDSLCEISINDEGWSGGCTAKSRVASGEPQPAFELVESPDGNDYRVWGVAPTSVTSAAVVMKDGTRVPVPLQDGAFDVTTDDPGTAFVWTDAQRIEHSQQVVLPPAQ